jgi:hypothetical protein
MLDLEKFSQRPAGEGMELNRDDSNVYSHSHETLPGNASGKAFTATSLRGDGIES